MVGGDAVCDPLIQTFEFVISLISLLDLQSPLPLLFLSSCPPYHQASTLSNVPAICFWMCRSPSRIVGGVCKYVWLIFMNGSVL